MAPFRYQIFVRYADVDQQGVVFNAHYLTYCDTAVDRWWDAVGLKYGDHDFDAMVVKAVLEWQGSARYAENIDIDVHVSRWGNTSFDLTCVGTIRAKSTFTANLTYVCVRHGTTDTMPVPDAVKAALSGT